MVSVAPLSALPSRKDAKELPLVAVVARHRRFQEAEAGLAGDVLLSEAVGALAGEGVAELQECARRAPSSGLL